MFHGFTYVNPDSSKQLGNQIRFAWKKNKDNNERLKFDKNCIHSFIWTIPNQFMFLQTWFINNDLKSERPEYQMCSTSASLIVVYAIKTKLSFEVTIVLSHCIK